MMKKPNAQYEVHLLLTVYKQANPDKLALFYPVITRSDNKYNYYLKPNANKLSVDLVKCCVNGVSRLSKVLCEWVGERRHFEPVSLLHV